MRSVGTPLVRPPSPSNRVIAWLRWFGPLRVAGAVLGALVLGAAGVWAVRAPAPGAAEVGVAASDERSASTAVDDPPPPVSTPFGDVPPVSLVGGSANVAPAVVVVHVAGAVVAPGVHRLGPGDRVVDAVEAAGGPLREARLDALNLAATVVDGERIYVPVHGEVVVAEPIPAVPPPIDLNRATSIELERLPGVGPAVAAGIVAERERSGPFVSVDDLLRVRGIGPVKLGAIRDHAVAS